MIEKMKNEEKTGLRGEQGGNEEMMHYDAFLLHLHCKSLVSEKSEVEIFVQSI